MKVVFLGAGASRASDFKLPTMDSFFDDDKIPLTLAGFLERFYGEFPPPEQDKTSRPNLEEVLTYLHLCEARDGVWTKWPHGENENVNYAGLLDYVCHRLDTPDAVCDLHRRLFEQLEPRDTVVTLNYDLVADRALHQALSEPPPFRSRIEKLWQLLGSEVVPAYPMDYPAGGMGSFQPGYYLKLHGSLDWLQCTGPTCPNRTGFRPRRHEIRTWSPLPRCHFCGAVVRPLLVPPISSKTELISARIQRMWTLAMDDLLRATTIVVVGISFAESDADLAWLIRRTRRSGEDQPHVVIVNPCPSARDRTKKLFGRYCTYGEHKYLEQYVEEESNS